MTMTPLFHLYSIIIATDDAGDSRTDALIASILNVSALLYTSNGTDAQSLKPTGWDWSLDDQENIVLVRASDGVGTGGPVFDFDGNIVTGIPDALTYCRAAIAARLVEADDRS